MTALVRGTRVTVHGAPGTVKYTDAQGMIAMQIDGDGAQVDLHRQSQVLEVVQVTRIGGGK